MKQFQYKQQSDISHLYTRQQIEHTDTSLVQLLAAHSDRLLTSTCQPADLARAVSVLTYRCRRILAANRCCNMHTPDASVSACCALPEARNACRASRPTAGCDQPSGVSSCLKASMHLQRHATVEPPHRHVGGTHTALLHGTPTHSMRPWWCWQPAMVLSTYGARRAK